MTTDSFVDLKLEKLENLRKSPAYLGDEKYKKVVDYTIETYIVGKAMGSAHVELTGALYLRRWSSTSSSVRNAAKSCWNILMMRSD